MSVFMTRGHPYDFKVSMMRRFAIQGILGLFYAKINSGSGVKAELPEITIRIILV